MILWCLVASGGYRVQRVALGIVAEGEFKCGFSSFNCDAAMLPHSLP